VVVSELAQEWEWAWALRSDKDQAEKALEDHQGAAKEGLLMPPGPKRM
jgi:hypothetical protein